MPEILTLTTPAPGPTTTTWKVEDIYMSRLAPSIKVTLISNTGERFVYRSVVSETTTAAQILTGLSFINQGKFKINQGKSLEKWLLDRISAEGVKVGTVSGTEE